MLILLSSRMFFKRCL